MVPVDRNATSSPSRRHSFPLSQLAPQLVTPAGSRTAVTAREFPALRGMSLYKLAIEPGCFREPHWHANADELGYCLAGEMLVTIFSTGNRHDVFRVKAGEMYLVPSGSFHSLENIGPGRLEVIAMFSHESPEDFGLSGSVGCMSAAVMGNTWGLDAPALAGLTRSPEDVVFGKSDGLARGDQWPALRTQSMFSLRLGGKGMREPHWHPETAEMGYVRAGRSRMTIKSPSGGAGSVDTFELVPGDLYFIPKGYPHHIENLGADELHFLIFFDRAVGEDIGYTGGIPAFPRRIVAPSLGMTERTLPRIPELGADAMIVGKRNPVDP
jgi:oxalate decarboxylase